MIESHIQWCHETDGNNKYRILWYKLINSLEQDTIETLNRTYQPSEFVHTRAHLPTAFEWPVDFRLAFPSFAHRIHQWLRQISMKLPFAVLRKSALKFTKGSKRENSISYYFLLFWFNQNSISVLKTLLSCLSEKTLWKVDSESLYREQGCMKSR